MFQPVSPKLNVIMMEEGILRLWKIRDVFHQSIQQREGAEEYIFYEGPPTANGIPGIHHILARAYKDVFPRYKTMRGYHVIRRSGWDTQGLPVEIEVERYLGFNNKQQIEAFGIAKFNQLCRESAFAYIEEWEKLTNRIGYWVDLDDAYITCENEYIESVWWILKNLWDKNLLYQDFKVLPYCPRCGTALSDHEVALGYRDTEDPSIYVRLPLVDSPDTSLVVWTTTPWTLPANVAVAVHPDVDYVTVERPLDEGGTERLILAKDLLKKVFPGEDLNIISCIKGKHLKGKHYQPLFTFLPLEKPAHMVVSGSFVTTEDGSGLVHIAPAYGAEDMQLAKEHDLPVLIAVKEDGTFTADVRPWSGKFVKDADLMIIQDLDSRGLLVKEQTCTHTYPFCWRCDTPLLYTSRSTWYIRTTQFKEKLVELNNQINWVPEHIKDGRFGNWLANNVDWALGRERYWGTPLPIWQCDACKQSVAVGSIGELSNLSSQEFSKLDLHRPYVDEIKFRCEKCGGTMKRVPEVIDCWFDSGSMPVAQWHYPFENQETFNRQFPADYICEAVDQTRGWFYTLHAISTMLFEKPCFKNAISLGLILDGEGQKMSKSRGNVVDPWEVINQSGADATRWCLYTAGPPGLERRFSAEMVSDVLRNFTLTLWNTYSFFVTYANLDKWKPTPGIRLEHNPMDRWLRSRLHTLMRDVTNALDRYDVLGATRPIETFVDLLSNWYLRRSRRRFWKSGVDADKQAAYTTLYEALATLSKLLAPTMPFLAEELYQNLARSVNAEAPESVHLSDWVIYDPGLIDDKLNKDMDLVIKLASLGHAARNKANRKVRQPLLEAAFAVGSLEENEIVERYANVLEEELNVKKVRVLNTTGEAASYSLNPLPKQLGSRFKGLFPQVSAALAELDAEKAVLTLMEGKSLSVQVEGKTYEITGEEVEARVQAREGFAVASDGAYLAALVTELTPELLHEGLARELIRRIQDLRKEAGLDISDRIHLYLEPSPRLARTAQNYRDSIMGETLSVDLRLGEIPPEVFQTSDNFDDEYVTIGLYKAN